MSAKSIFVFFSSILLIKAVYSQCIPRELNYGCGGLGLGLADNYGLGLGLANNYGLGLGLADNYGLGLAGLGGINPGYGCNTPNYPIPNLPMQPGVSISADNLIIDGFLDAAGRLPFIGTVAVEGVLGNNGGVSVVYNCGNGNVGITEAGYGGNAGVGSIGPVRGYNVGSALDLNRLGGCGCL